MIWTAEDPYSEVLFSPHFSSTSSRVFGRLLLRVSGAANVTLPATNDITAIISIGTAACVTSP